MKLLKEIDWLLDYYVFYFLYKTDKIHRYHEYMTNKWKEKYTYL